MKIELPCARELNFHIFDEDAKKTITKKRDRRASWDASWKHLKPLEA